MAPVGGRPFLDYLLSWLRSEGVKEVILCVGFKRSHIRRFVSSGRKWGLRANYSIEQKLLGTAGAVKKAERLVCGERLLIVNGDTFVGVKLREMMKFHLHHKAVATIATTMVADSGRYGSVRIGRRGRVIGFREKGETFARDARGKRKGLINAGVYLFEKKLLKRISAGKRVSLEKEVLPSILAKRRVFGFASKGYFLDIGIPKDLRRAQIELPKRIHINHSR